MSTDTDLQGRKWIKGCMTKSYKLDTLCKNATIIKMDIEGFEHELLYKCVDKLDNVKNWLIEIHSWEDINYHGWTNRHHNKKSDSLNKMIKLFLKNGYTRFILAKKRKKEIIISENTYWTDIPTSSYKQNNEIIYYKVVNLIISK